MRPPVRLLLVVVAFSVAVVGAYAAPLQESALRLTKVVSGLQRPVFVTVAPGEPNRLYIAEQAGVIRILDRGNLRSAPFLDIRSLVGSAGSEQGLLGLAFDPATQRTTGSTSTTRTSRATRMWPHCRPTTAV